MSKMECKRLNCQSVINVEDIPVGHLFVFDLTRDEVWLRTMTEIDGDHVMAVCLSTNEVKRLNRFARCVEAKGQLDWSV